MEKFTRSADDYLEAIYALSIGDQQPIRSVDVARRLGYSAPSVCRAIGKLKEEGFLTVDRIGGLWLTDKGKERGKQVHQKAEYFKQFLMRSGIEETEAARNASTLKHAISDECYLKLLSQSNLPGDEKDE